MSHFPWPWVPQLKKLLTKFDCYCGRCEDGCRRVWKKEEMKEGEEADSEWRRSLGETQWQSG